MLQFRYETFNFVDIYKQTINHWASHTLSIRIEKDTGENVADSKGKTVLPKVASHGTVAFGASPKLQQGVEGARNEYKKPEFVAEFGR